MRSTRTTRTQSSQSSGRYASIAAEGVLSTAARKIGIVARRVQKRIDRKPPSLKNDSGAHRRFGRPLILTFLDESSTRLTSHVFHVLWRWLAQQKIKNVQNLEFEVYDLRGDLPNSALELRRKEKRSHTQCKMR